MFAKSRAKLPVSNRLKTTEFKCWGGAPISWTEYIRITMRWKQYVVITWQGSVMRIFDVFVFSIWLISCPLWNFYFLIRYLCFQLNTCYTSFYIESISSNHFRSKNQLVQYLTQPPETFLGFSFVSRRLPFSIDLIRRLALNEQPKLLTTRSVLLVNGRLSHSAACKLLHIKLSTKHIP